MKQPAKKLTLAILVTAFLVGLVGCFLAFRRNAINGESEAQEKKMNEYFRDTTTSSFFRKDKK